MQILAFPRGGKVTAQKGVPTVSPDAAIFSRPATYVNLLAEMERNTDSPPGIQPVEKGFKMNNSLKNKRIAILATEGFEYVELTEPKKALEAAGAYTEVISPKDGKVRGWNHTDWGDSVRVDVNLKSANADNYDALVLPGGVMNPDHLRQDRNAVQFVKAFFDAHKPVAAICHGPWMLVEADVLRGRKLTSWPSLRTDIRNAGGEWVDQEVVTDGGLVTSRKPDDLPAFNKSIIEEVSQSKHQAQPA